MAIVDMSKHFTAGMLLKYAAPVIASMVFTSVYSIVDGLFVSNFAGKTDFAALNLIVPFIMILSAVGFMMGTGGAALVSKTRGEGNGEDANRQFSLIVYVTIVAGVVLGVLGALLMEPVGRLLGATDELIGPAVLYGRISMISLFAFMLQFMFQDFFATAGKPKLGFVVTVISGVANIIGDAVLVGALDLGIVGAASATVTSELLGGIIPLVYFARKNTSFLKLGRCSLDLRVIGRTCVNGSSEMMANIAMNIVAMLYNYQLILIAGENGVAAYGVIMYVAMVFNAIFIGYTMGTAPLVSFQYGAKNPTEIKSLLKHGLGLMAGTGVLMLALAQLLAWAIAFIFCSYDAELMAMTEFGFRIYSIAFLLMGISIFGSSFFTALNNGLVSALISFVRTLVFEVGSVLLLPMVLGLTGVWLSVVVAECASVLLTSILLYALGPTYGYRR